MQRSHPPLLFRPRVSLDGVPGRILDVIDTPEPVAIVKFDGPTERASEWQMASAAGCTLLVQVAELDP